MKKYNLLKVLAITVFIAWLLILIIPGSYADYTGNITTGEISGVGIWALLSNFSISISYFNGIAVFLIAVACFYGILNKLDSYKNILSKTAKKFENKKGLLVVISIIFFGIVASLVNDALILIVFMPFVYGVMKELKIDNKVILSSTIVASLIGAMSSIYNNTLFSAFSLEVNTLLLVKVIMLVISLAILIFFVAPKKEKTNKKEDKEETKTKKVKITVTQKEETKKAAVKKAPAKKKTTVKKTTKAGKGAK